MGQALRMVVEGAAAVGLAGILVKAMSAMDDHMDAGYPVTADYPQISVNKNQPAPVF